MNFKNLSLQTIVHHLTSWQQAIRDHSILEMARNRSLVIGGVFVLAFLVIVIRLSDVMLLRNSAIDDMGLVAANTALIPHTARADILDRNGEILATHIVTGSVYANPKVIKNPEESARKLSKLIPELNYESLLKKLKSEKGFVWLVRHIPPRLQKDVNSLGLPGVYLHRDERRLYPHGNLASHILGYCGIDDNGLAGVEKYFDALLRSSKDPLQLSIDMRVQHAVHDELTQAINHFEAEGGNAMVMKVETGELVAMISLPDYDPNLPNQNIVETTFNRNTLGLYESGSTFKIFNTAIALETGKAKLSTIYDASTPIKIGRYTITDFKGQHRPLDVREVFIHSSNIGSAKMALHFGGPAQCQYLGRFGILEAPKIELPEVARPLLPPKAWRDVTTMTVAYGYGIAVSPLQLLNGVCTVITGIKRTPTLLKQNPEHLAQDAHPVLSAKTSQQIRELMRLVVHEGTARSADVPGYDVIGKTGTAHRNKGKSYNDSKRTSFIGAFPKDNPQYVVILFLDNPKPQKETYGYATAGWTAAPTAGKIIARIAPILGVAPKTENGLNSSIEDRMIAIRHTVENHD